MVMTNAQHEQDACEEAHHVLDFLAAERQREYSCGTIYCGDLEMLATWRWLLGFDPNMYQPIDMLFPAQRLWALAWRVNTAFPPIDVVAEAAREWSHRRETGELAAGEDFFAQMQQIIAGYSVELEREAVYRTSVARCLLSAATSALGTSDELKLLIEAGQWATHYLSRPDAGDISWAAVFEDPSDTSCWIMRYWHAGFLAQRTVFRAQPWWYAKTLRSSTASACAQ